MLGGVGGGAARTSQIHANRAPGTSTFGLPLLSLAKGSRLSGQ